MSLPPGFIEELRQRVSLADLVGRKVSWDRSKTNAGRGDWWAPCPFHQERTASFHVLEREGRYYCFGCQAKGDAISFLRDTENMGFMEAVELLAREAGMPMPAQDPQAAAKAKARDALAEAMEACVQWYRLQLRAAKGEAARDHLAGRGLDEATLSRFEIGFAPEDRRGLAEAMAAKGIGEDALVRTGMLIRPEEGGPPFDRFRGRIMFPIRDARGRCIAFGGRATLESQKAKYLNSPETELFDKGASLYNHGPARAAAGKAGRLVVAEGYMDVIALHRAGVEEAVAPLGTAVTERQLALLWRMADEPIVALDGDAAGLRAAARLGGMALGALSPGKSLRFALMPEGKDPDDLLALEGPAGIVRVLEAAEPLVETIWRDALAGRDLSTPERRAAFEADVRARLKRIPDDAVRAHYAAAFRERRDALFRPQGARGGPSRAFGGRRFGGPGGRSARFAPRFGFAEAGFAEPTPETRRSLLVTADEATEARIRESAILWGALHHPETAERHEDALRNLPFMHRDLADMLDTLLDALPDALAAEDAAEALRGALAAGLGADPRPFLTTERLSLTRALGPGSARGEVEVAFAELVDRHAVFLSAAEESRAAEDDISLETADEIAHRLAYISVQREAATRRRSGPEGDADDDARLSARLEALRAEEPWRRRPGRGTKFRGG